MPDKRIENILCCSSSRERVWSWRLRSFTIVNEVKPVFKAQEAFENINITPEPRKCPKCGQDLVVRDGNDTRFFGCSSFPSCRHTEKINKQWKDLSNEWSFFMWIFKTLKFASSEQVVHKINVHFVRERFSAWNRTEIVPNRE
jgi:hypothetical protein